MQLRLSPECAACPNAAELREWAEEVGVTIVYLEDVERAHEFEVESEGRVSCDGFNFGVPDTALDDYCQVHVEMPIINKRVYDERTETSLGLLALRIPVVVPPPELLGEKGIHSGLTGLALPKSQ